MKAVAQLARLYYVERCHKTFVVNAPAWFGISFRVVSPFLSARTRQKIRILGSDLTVLQDEIAPQVSGVQLQQWQQEQAVDTHDCVSGVQSQQEQQEQAVETHVCGRETPVVLV